MLPAEVIVFAPEPSAAATTTWKPPPARVAYDFWRQFRLAEELEEIRQTRPAAFRALPASPEERGIVADLGARREPA